MTLDIEKIKAAEKEVSRLKWIIGLHPAIDPTVISMKESEK